ncbi:hypothetical protein CBL_14167 [Carabus blaptoides fortunei]
MQGTLYQFKGQPWSSLSTFFRESSRSKSREDYSVVNCTKQDIDMETGKKREIDVDDLTRFKGQPWSAFIKTFDMNTLLGSPEKDNGDCRVTRLPRDDMGLFGICPLNDRFCAVVCSICGAVVKFQGLQRHMEIRHSSDSETVLLPPPQVPVKKTKTVNLKMKNKESIVTSATIHSSESIVPCLQPAMSSVKNTDMLVNTNSTITSATAAAVTAKSYVSKINSNSNNLLQPYDNDSTHGQVSRRKSPNTSSDRKAQKSRDKEYEQDKHVSTNDDTKSQQNNRTANSKTHSSTPPRRTVTGRTKDFNKLVAEHRATKDSQANVTVTNSSKSRVQSILRTVVTTPDVSDTEISPTGGTTQSSHSIIPDPVPDMVTSPPVASPLSPAISSIQSTTTTSTNVNMSTCPAEYLGICNSVFDEPGASSNSNSATNISMDIDVVIPATCTAGTYTSHGIHRNTVTNVISNSSLSVVSSTSSNSSGISTVPQVLHVTPFSSSHVYTYSSPLIILNPKETTTTPVCMPSMNLNVNTETVSSTNSMVPVLNVAASAPTSPQPVVVSREVIESLNVPVVMDMPTLPDSLANITVYASYPKPLVVSTFSAKKVGNHVVFSSSNRRLEFIRSKFKSVLKKGRRVSTNGSMSLKNVQSGGAGGVVVSTLSGVKSTVVNANTGTGTTTCRFPKTTATVSNIQQATSLLAHRPNILRTTTPRPHLPKILTAGLKRPATSSQQQLAGLDCKHMLLKPPANNINVSGIIGKMIVHQHEVADVGDGPTANHLALDKVVPVNIK